MLSYTDYSMIKTVVFLQSFYEETNNYVHGLNILRIEILETISYSNYAETIPGALNLGYYTIVKILLGVIPKSCRTL